MHTLPQVISERLLSTEVAREKLSLYLPETALVIMHHDDVQPWMRHVMCARQAQEPVLSVLPAAAAMM